MLNTVLLFGVRPPTPDYGDFSSPNNPVFIIVCVGAEHTIDLGVRPPNHRDSSTPNNPVFTIVWAGAEHTIRLGVRPHVTTTTFPITDSSNLDSSVVWVGAEHIIGL